MASASLSAQPREERKKSGSRRLRAAGRIPAVIYGHGEATRSLTLDAHELERLFSHIHKENTIINLKIEGEKADVRALVREVQSHPFRGTVLHVDFYQVHAGERITVSIPVVLVGTPKGVRAGGILQHTMNDLEIRISADLIPEDIRIDVSDLDIGDSFHVSDLQLPEGAEILAEADQGVCSVSAPAVAVADPVAVEAAPTTGEPEVIRRKKEDDAK